MHKVLELQKKFEETDAKYEKANGGLPPILPETEEGAARRYGIGYMMQRDEMFKLLMEAVLDAYSEAYINKDPHVLCLRIVNACMEHKSARSKSNSNLNS